MPPIPLDSLLGAHLIGLIFSSVIYGITCLQVFLYYTEYSSRDGAFLRTFVALVMVLDTLHLALLTHTTYYWTVTNFGNYLALTEVWSSLVQIVIGSTIFVAFEWWFAWKIYRLSREQNWWIPAIMVFLSLAHWSCALGYTIQGFRIPAFAEQREVLPWAWAGYAAEFACDVVMTSTMIYYLNRDRTPFSSRTNRALTMLMTYSLNTGLLVTIFTLLMITLTTVEDKNLIYAPFYYTLIRLYSCSFMSTLNTRQTVRSALEGDGEVIMFASMGPSTQSPENGGDAHRVLDIKPERRLSFA